MPMESNPDSKTKTCRVIPLCQLIMSHEEMKSEKLFKSTFCSVWPVLGMDTFFINVKYVLGRKMFVKKVKKRTVYNLLRWKGSCDLCIIIILYLAVLYFSKVRDDSENYLFWEIWDDYKYFFFITKLRIFVMSLMFLDFLTRVGNSLYDFSSESLVFVSERAIRS